MKSSRLPHPPQARGTVIRNDQTLGPDSGTGKVASSDVRIRSLNASPEGAEGFGRLAAAGALITGGVLWVAAAVIGGDDGTSRFYAAEVVWLVAQVALLAGTVLLWQARPHGRRRLGDAGFALATAGRVVFVAAEAVALASGETADELLPVAALLTAVGMVLAGIAVVRERRWTTWARFAPLAVGVFPFLAMFPFAASDADGPPVVSMVVWGLAFAALGVAAREQGGRIAGARSSRDRLRRPDENEGRG